MKKRAQYYMLKGKKKKKEKKKKCCNLEEPFWVEELVSLFWALSRVAQMEIEQVQ